MTPPTEGHAPTRPLSDAQRGEIAAELRRAAEAIGAGNDGKARVCARRACGVALRAWREGKPGGPGPSDAQALLVEAAADEFLPLPVREAAKRLSSPVSGRVEDITTAPIADAELIIATLYPASGAGPAPFPGPPPGPGNV